MSNMVKCSIWILISGQKSFLFRWSWNESLCCFPPYSIMCYLLIRHYFLYLPFSRSGMWGLNYHISRIVFCLTGCQLGNEISMELSLKGLAISSTMYHTSTFFITNTFTKRNAGRYLLKEKKVFLEEITFMSDGIIVELHRVNCSVAEV